MKQRVGICAFLGVFILSCLAAFCAIGANFSFASAMSGFTESTGGRLAYGYIMSLPVAVDTDGNRLYVLDSRGQIVSPSSRSVIATEENASRFAVCGGVAVTNKEADARDVFAFETADGEIGRGEITPSAIYFRDPDGENSVFVSAEENTSFLCGDAFDGKLYVCVRRQNGVAVVAYDLSDASQTLVKNNVVADDEIHSIAVKSENEIYYATPYSLYRLNGGGENVGGITSLSTDGQAIFYTTRSGKVCRRTETGEETILLRAAETVSVATRKNFAVFTDCGNNKITVVRGNTTTSAEVLRPTSATVDYAGRIYVASEERILVYSRTLEPLPEETTTLEGNDETVTKIGIDPSDVTDNAVIYALTADGILHRTSDESTLSDIKRFEIRQNGEIYVMKTDGSVLRYARDLSGGTEVVAAGDYVDLTVDRAGNLFLTDGTALYKVQSGNPVAVSGVTFDEASEIAVSSVEIGGKNAVGFGDIIAFPAGGCESVLVPRAVAGTDMRDDKNDSTLTNFLAAHNTDKANAKTDNPDIRKTVMVTEVYAFPSETPNAYGEAGIDTHVIVIAAYPDSDYLYAIVEAPNHSMKGFIRKQAMTDSLPLVKLYEQENCYATVKTKVYQYPTVNSPAVSETVLGNAYPFCDFVDGYRDSAGRIWYRIFYLEDGFAYEGYIIRSTASFYGYTGGQFKQIVPDATVKADSATVVIYDLLGGAYVPVGSIASGTEIQLEETFKKGNEYTQITYVVDDKTGETRTCYVKTEFVKPTVGTWYQVVMFVVAGVLVAALIVIVIVVIHRRRKID